VKRHSLNTNSMAKKKEKAPKELTPGIKKANERADK
jgi:hypothetical protein